MLMLKHYDRLISSNQLLIMKTFLLVPSYIKLTKKILHRCFEAKVDETNAVALN